MALIPLRQYALHTSPTQRHQLEFWDALEASLTEEQRQLYGTDGALRSKWAPPVTEAVPAEGIDNHAVALAAGLIKEFEGLELEAYPDPETGGDPWTIGWGSTAFEDGSPVVRGQRITRERADLLLNRRLARDVRLLAMRITGWGGLSLGQRAALLSFSYNCGIDWFGAEGFRTITAAVRSQRWDEVPAAMELYVNPGGPSEAGLRRRRQAEIAMYRGESKPPAISPSAVVHAGIQEWSTKVQALKLSQPDAATCQAACIAMAVRDPDIMGVRRRLQQIGVAGDPAVMGRVIRDYKVPYQYEGSASLKQVYQWLRDGELLITHGWFTASGHVIVLDGLRFDEPSGRYLLNVADPWSEFDAPSWAYRSSSKFYDGFYSELCIFAACVAGGSVSHARDLYRAGRVNRDQRAMWVHRIQPE